MKKNTPLQAIRKYCLDDMNNQPKEVRFCPSKKCSLYPYRFRKREIKGSTIKAIRARCLDCSAWSTKEGKECPFENCYLYLYRFGKNPSLKGKRGNPEALKMYRNKKNNK